MPALKHKAETRKLYFNSLLQAIKFCILEKKSVRSTAQEYGIDKNTLRRNIKKVEENYDDIAIVEDDELLEFLRMCSRKTPCNMIFTPSQEKDLVDYILKYVDHYHGLTLGEVKQLAFQFANKLKLKYFSSWDDDATAGPKWCRLFMKRHPELTLRHPEQISLNRVKAFSKPIVEKYFSNLGNLLEKHLFGCNAIYNMAECGFSAVPSKMGKVIVLNQGIRKVASVETLERGTMLTMALTVNAYGNSIPSFFLFPRKEMETGNCLDNVLDGTVGLANESGLMGQPEFVQYLWHFIRFVNPSLERPVLLLLDSHTSHLSVEALDIASENGIHILSFPPYCRHKLNPLEVSVFGSLENYFISECSTWSTKNDNKVFKIQNIPELVCAALDSALMPKTIKMGFTATGIAPYNPNIFSDTDFANYSNPFEDNESEQQTRIILVDAAKKDDHDGEVFIYHSSISDEIDPLQDLALKRVKRKLSKKILPNKATSPSKRHKANDSLPLEEDFCIICLSLLPTNMTSINSTKCSICQLPVHLKCATETSFTCKICEHLEDGNKDKFNYLLKT
ncbi:uncharacterized protein LOC111518520 [Drosophila willistoni]|uniref:uncharacterized protein LOC111518520 n=1 Tax=Drosophila willistoni TaxID=7260 RepID=UPI001F07C8C3|nr:uncharacterized protein LOC111518520 [Drosophila willistoni]